MKLTRRYRFSASHRLDTPALTAEQNSKLYGKCNNPFGHGHDYVLDVTMAGSPDESGQIVSREALDTLVEERVLARFDHHNLNTDIAELTGVVPTTETLAVVIEKALADGWPLRARLDRVRISETERNIFELEAK
ncbi:MAG: 6-carboxytetrahydropterin synthase [Bryobacteraceae bacterium]